MRKPQADEISQGVNIIHDVTSANSDLKYVGFKVVDLTPGSAYTEDLKRRSVCIVAVTGKITVTDYDQTFESIGTRESVFERKPTDSVYVSNDRSFEITAVSGARVALCYSPSEHQLPTKLIKAEDNGVEHRGKLANKRTVHNILPIQIHRQTAFSLLKFTRTAATGRAIRLINMTKTICRLNPFRRNLLP